MTEPVDPGIHAAAAALAAELPAVSSGVFLVLGSAQAAFADRLEIVAQKSFSEIPSLGSASAAGHSGRLLICRMNEQTVAVCAGRRHLYETAPNLTPVIFPAVLAAAMGCDRLVLTNASGSMQPNKMPIGSIVAISDHINLLGIDPLRGEGASTLGVERTNGMGTIYSAELRALAKAAGREAGLELPEGTYLALPGPSFETAAEIRMYAEFADLVGMSTVPEAMVWQAMAHKAALKPKHRPLKLLALSTVTNLAQGLSSQEVSVAEVLQEGANSADRFESLLKALLPKLARAKT